ncbi:MAG: hypothetical protein JST16_12070 [Bdellovibrionales bacterium]|nr:hypothetical protein [Bdellovibrionales bacterium]
MGWIYILVRTFPFWGIPIALIFITMMTGKKSKSIPKTTRMGYLSLAAAMIIGSVLFFILGGPLAAVPQVHNFLYQKY